MRFFCCLRTAATAREHAHSKVQQVRLQGSHVSLSLSVKAHAEGKWPNMQREIESKRDAGWLTISTWMQLEKLRCISHTSFCLMWRVRRIRRGPRRGRSGGNVEQKRNNKIVALLIESTKTSMCKDNYYGKQTVFELKYFRLGLHDVGAKKFRNHTHTHTHAQQRSRAWRHVCVWCQAIGAMWSAIKVYRR